MGTETEIKETDYSPNLTIEEDLSVLHRRVTQSGWRTYFERHSYTHSGQNAVYSTFGQLNRYEKYLIYDLLLVFRADTLQEVTVLIPQIEAKCAEVRRALLQGRPIIPQITVKKHHFLTLHKPYVQYSYIADDLPVGISIHPLVLLDEPNQWEYIEGQTTRIDCVSEEQDAVEQYLTHHCNLLHTDHRSHLKLSKYFLWQISTKLLDYGHYPLIFAWIGFFISSIFLLPIQITLEQLIFLTGGIYGGLIAFSIIAHRYFQWARRKELQAFPYCRTVPMAVPVIEKAMLPEEHKSSSLEATVAQFIAKDEISREVLPHIPQQKVQGRPNTERVRVGIEAILNTRESSLMLKEGELFLRALLSRLQPGVHHNTLPNPSENCSTLLRSVHDHPAIAKHLEPLQFWIQKIETSTPFDQQEIQGFKKFLLFLLYDLKLLPDKLRLLVQKSMDRQLESDSQPQRIGISAVNRLNSRQQEIAELYAQIEHFPVTFHPNSEDSIPSSSFDEATLPDFHPVAFQTKLAELTSSQFRETRANEKNGFFCVLYIDRTDPQTPQYLTRFEACVKDLVQIAVNYMDITQMSDPIVLQTIGDTSAPFVLLGCGRTIQCLPYDDATDDVRLLAAIQSFDRPIRNLNLKDLSTTPRTSRQDLSLHEVQNQEIQEVTSGEASRELDIYQMEIQQKSAQKIRYHQERPVILKIRQILANQSVLIDGSNVAHLIQDTLRDDSGPQLKTVQRVITALEAYGITRDKLLVFFDAATLPKMSAADRAQIKEYAKEGFIRKIAGGEDADRAILQVGRLLSDRYIVISNDMYRDFQDLAAHRVSIGLGPAPDLAPHFNIDFPGDFLHAYYGMAKIAPTSQITHNQMNNNSNNKKTESK